MSRESPAPTVPRRRLPATVIALGVTSLFADVGSEMIFPLLPVFVTSLGASTTFLGLVEGVANATSSLLKLAAGYFTDRSQRRKPLVVLGYAIAALTRPLMALASAPWHVLSVRVTDRIGKGLRTAPRDVLIAESAAPGDVGRAFGFHSAMDHAGAVVGPLVATLLLTLGWQVRDIFWLALIPGALSVLVVLSVRERKAREAQRPIAIAASSVELPPSLRRYFGILLLFSLVNSSDAFLLLRANDLGVQTSVLPLLWAAFHVSKLLSSYLGGAWSDRVPRATLIVWGWLVYAGTYLGFAVATQPWHAWLLFIAYGSYYGLTEPAEKAMVKDLAPESVRGRAFGFYNFIVGISAIPAGLLTGWLWQTWGPFVALATGAGVAGASALALTRYSRRPRFGADACPG